MKALVASDEPLDKVVLRTLQGLLIGVTAGVATGAMFLALVATLGTIAIPLVVPWTTAIPLLAVLAGTWVAGLLGAFSIRRMDVAQVLKLRGG